MISSTRTARICLNSREVDRHCTRQVAPPVNKPDARFEIGAMKIFRPDHDRQIDLPGAGLCPRPVDLDQAVTGFSALRSLRVYSFAADVVINGEAEDDEVFIVLMRGEAQIDVSNDGRLIDTFSLNGADGVRVVYMPPLASYRLVTSSGCDIAYARVQHNTNAVPEVRGFARTSNRLEIAGHALGMNLLFVHAETGDVVDLAMQGQSHERFVHIRSDDHATFAINDELKEDWDSAALSDGENASLNISSGSVDLLWIGAS